MADLNNIPAPSGKLAVPAPRVPEIITEVSLPKRQEPPMVDKIKALWVITEQIVSEVVIAAEVLHAPKSGAEKKSFVRNKVLEFLKDYEEKHDYLPSLVQGFAFTAIVWTLDFLIERVFRELEKKGLVNVPA